MHRVVVTGMGAVAGLGSSAQENWENILADQTGVSSISLFNTDTVSVKIASEIKNFDATGCLDPKETQRASRFVQVAAKAAQEAMQSAGAEDLQREDFGCCLGVGIGAIQDIEKNSLILDKKGQKRISPFFIPYSIPNMAAGVVSNFHSLKGPNLCTTTACTSGTHAIGEAYNLIRLGMAKSMLAGGAEACLGTVTIVGFANMKSLCTENDSPETASRPFDASRNGFVIGEGAGILVLEEMEQAKKRGAPILAELVGYGMSGDAYHITSPAPEGAGAQRCMQMALKDSGLSAEDISYVNAHGTSTKLNDYNESIAVQKVFGSSVAEKILISSTKGAVGHCLGAAGGIEAVLAVKTLTTGIAPHTRNLKEIDPELPKLDFVKDQPRQATMKAVLSNSFGFGGTNGSLIFKAV